MLRSHELARTMEGDYQARLALALRIAWKEERGKEEVKIEKIESGGTWLVTEEAMKRLYGEPKGVKNMQYYRKGNIIIEQCGWEWANDYTFSSDDYEVGAVVCQSTAEWLEQGYEQIDKQELIEEIEARGYVVDIEDYLEEWQG